MKTNRREKLKEELVELNEAYDIAIANGENERSRKLHRLKTLIRAVQVELYGKPKKDRLNIAVGLLTRVLKVYQEDHEIMREDSCGLDTDCRLEEEIKIFLKGTKRTRGQK